MTTKYLIDIPNLDPSKPWIVIKECDTKDKAISFTKKTWGAENGYLCLISHDGEYFNIDVPNFNYTSTSRVLNGAFCKAQDRAVSQNAPPQEQPLADVQP